MYFCSVSCISLLSLAFRSQSLLIGILILIVHEKLKSKKSDSDPEHFHINLLSISHMYITSIYCIFLYV